jgi:radical SAM protein with 4Fe4S-binding SPASM domain
MKEIGFGNLYGRLHNKKEHFPYGGQLELTYRCNLDCVHCFCKGLEEKGKRLKVKGERLEHRELSTKEWKKILDIIHREGCLWLTFSGGEPLMREDFLDIYSYAKSKGFLITIFTNGQALTSEILDYFSESPPHLIEITLNGITKDTYESITQIDGSFEKIMAVLAEIKKRGLRLILKSNCLKQNKDELGKLKQWTEDILGRPSKKTFYYKYDPMIYPRLDGDKTPCKYRLSFEELQEAKRQDKDIWEEYQRGLHSDFPELKKDKDFLYRCNSWMNQFFINPYGRLKFCEFSDKFSIDLKTIPFKEGFYNFPRVLNERFKTDSKCKDCRLRPICYHCPARAYLETGNEEAPVEYYCKLAKATSEKMEKGSLAR